MRSSITITSLLFVSAAVNAYAAKPCADLKTEIAQKIEAHGVKSYSLEIVASEKAKDANGKVIGSCEGGTRKIVYRRTTAPSIIPAAAASTVKLNRH